MNNQRDAVRDFSVPKYAQVCAALVAAGYRSLTLAEYFQAGGVALASQRVILRHDIDRFPRMALPLARIEQAAGLRATYYFRVPATCDPATMRAVAALGHEVGFHYENLSKERGDVARARVGFAADLAALRRCCEILTVSMHGSPASRIDNRALWRALCAADFKLLGEAYLDVDFRQLMYYTDTGRTWEEGRFNIRDAIPDGQPRVLDTPAVRTTDELIDLIARERRNLYLVAHPERWPVSLGGWALAGTKDLAFNWAKLAIRGLLAIRANGRGTA